MFLEMSCSCGATLQAESGDYDTLVMFWANSFIEAHHECGFMAKPKPIEIEKTKRYDIMSKEQREKEL